MLELLELEVDALYDLDLDQLLKLEAVTGADEQDDFDVGLVEAVDLLDLLTLLALLRLVAILEFEHPGLGLVEIEEFLDYLPSFLDTVRDDRASKEVLQLV